MQFPLSKHPLYVTIHTQLDQIEVAWVFLHLVPIRNIYYLKGFRIMRRFVESTVD